MVPGENTPLIDRPSADENGRNSFFSPPRRVLLAGFLISVSLSFTQVPIIFVFRLMTCDEFYRHHEYDGAGDRCSRSEIDAGTATQVSILGLSTVFCGVFNLFYSGWQIKTWGPRAALIVQTAFPALRVAIQVVGVTIGFGEGIRIIQLSQVISLVGGMAGYLLVLNTAAGELVPSSQRTGMFGMLQGSVMLGTSVGYLLGGVVGDAWGIRRPFEIATVLFTLSSAYSFICIPYIDPKTLTNTSGPENRKARGWKVLSSGLSVILPKRLRLKDGRLVYHFGITFLAIGVFLGVLATGYAPILIQMYSTTAFNFSPKENGYLMAMNSFIRGIYLMLFFPKIIALGRKWYSSKGTIVPMVISSDSSLTGNSPSTNKTSSVFCDVTPFEDADSIPSTDTIETTQEHSESCMKNGDKAGCDFDLAFLRWSLVVDGLVTASTAFAVRSWQIYLAGFLLPLASGSAPASKGVITEMCPASERADALQAMTLVENIAMLSTLGIFGFIFSSFADVGKSYLTFYCNAVIALVAVGILFFSRFPPEGSTLEVPGAIDEDEP